MSAADTFREPESTIGGAPPRHIDLETALLDRYARGWIDFQQHRKRLAQHEMPESIVADFEKVEKRASTLLTRTLRAHPLWPWLAQYPGLGGAHVALVIGRIGDPRRFPGQRCSEGHYLPPLYAVGAPCPIADTRRGIEIGIGGGAEFPGADDMGFEVESATVCPGVMLPPRTTTGVRSLWHWAGLHVLDNGRAPRRTKGQRADWEPRVRASVMQPGGIAEQIVRLNVPRYSDVYRDAKARLTHRVADWPTGIDGTAGDAASLPPETQSGSEKDAGGQPLRAAEIRAALDSTPGRPLRPFEADRIARKVAAKHFLGDLLTEWKGVVA